MPVPTDEGVYSDSDGDYEANSPSFAFPSHRSTGDINSHLDYTDGSPDVSDDESLDPGQDMCDCRAFPELVGNFSLLAKHKLDGTGTHMHVVKWRSEKSGLSVIWADTPDLISTFSTTVVTEIFNSSGVPHTLEHLTFTASKQYPFSNVLDAIASRSMTEGVNAATDIDNTTYTVESASEEGMLDIIPVYLSHILFPEMNESIFKTEIYHINGKGEEGGTVFSEMAGREGSKEDVMALAQQQALYNFGNGYRYETGGMLSHLRTLTLKKITDYHKVAYVPQNMTVVVTGHQIDPQRLLETISQTTEREIEKAGLAQGPHPRGWIRPFVKSSTADNDPIIEKDKTILVPYAETDDSTGEIQISFLGPRIRDSLTISALGVLGDYLSGSSHSVLNRKFVEISEPACAGISFEVLYRDPTIFTLNLAAVAKNRLSTLAGDLKIVFKELCRKPFDMAAIQLVIQQQKVGLKRMRQTSPGVYVKASLLQDIIYGKSDGSDFSRTFDDLEMLKRLSKWKEADWLDLFKEFLVERHSIVLIGTPTPALVQQNTQADAARVGKNVRKFGPAGLARLDEELKEAERKNNRPPPASLVHSFPVPDFRQISWLSVDTARSNGVGKGKNLFHGRAQQIINADGPDLPFFVQFDHVSSSFVTVSLFLHGPALTILPLYVDTFFSMPVDLPGGQRLSWQEVSKKTDEDLTSLSVTSVHEGLWISLTALRHDYDKAVSWLSDFLFDTVFDVERLKNLVNTRLQVSSAVKQDGSGMAKAAIDFECFTNASFETPTNPIASLDYYPKLKDRLEHDPQSVVRELETLRTALIDPRAMRLSVVGDLSKLDCPSSTWLDCFEPVETFPTSQLAPIFRPRELLTSLGSKPAKKAVVYRIDSSESTYLSARSSCPDWNSPDFVAVDVACAVLSQTNGSLWNVTRTAGLCYGCTIETNVEHGFVSLDIYRSPNSIAALAAVRELLNSIKSGKINVKTSELDAAKSQLAFETVEGECTPSKAASNSFFDTVILNKPHGFSKQYLSLVERVTVADVHRAIDNWIVPLTSPNSSIIGATASPAKMSTLVGGLTKLGYEVEQRHF
ncbi:uncharacterized protein JCM6883_004795 [Sporobolomyces salmoneus]|uniref:uncharacterized protein n=1 Tax=Sporobolomyces salmoneus TaxID=183962 RepID=UPI0031736ECF